MKNHDNPEMEGEEGKKDFPPTHWSLILNDHKRESCLAELSEKYWTPVYLFLLKSGYEREEAQDLTQNLFLEMMDPKLLEKADPQRGKFRSYLIGVVKNLGREIYRKRSTQKNKPPKALFSLDFASGEEGMKDFLEPGYSPEDAFNKEWARLIVSRAMEKLRTYCQEKGKEERILALEAFEQAFFENKKPQEIAEGLNRDVKWVSEKIYRLKEKYGVILKSIVRETLDEGENPEMEINQLMEYL